MVKSGDLQTQYACDGICTKAHMVALWGVVGDHAGAHNHDSCPVQGLEDGQRRPALPEQRQRLCCARTAQAIPASSRHLCQLAATLQEVRIWDRVMEPLTNHTAHLILGYH